MRLMIFAAAALVLAACGPQNTGLNTLQLSSDTVPFPATYQVEAARVAATLPRADGATVLVSRPQPTLGATPLSPQRWYVCISGLASPASAPAPWPDVTTLAGTLIDPSANRGRHDVVLFFNGSNRPSMRQGTDAPLCRTVTYEPLTAAAPLA